jgi:hypothetical protein
MRYDLSKLNGLELGNSNVKIWNRPAALEK